MLGLLKKWIDDGRLGKREPRTFDYTRRRWGHDLGFTPIDGGMKMRAYGWGPAPLGGDELKREYMEVGDFIILAHPGGQETTRYRIDEIRYEINPRDQWFAKFSFAPRSASEDRGQGNG